MYLIYNHLYNLYKWFYINVLPCYKVMFSYIYESTSQVRANSKVNILTT